MITDVPTPNEFQAAGLNQVYLAWQIAMQSVHDYDESVAYSAEDDPDATAEYWRRSQPALANAYSLIQQGMELALKGRIASVSPYLLIGNPSDWTGRAADGDVSFGEFRTLDAADLFKVHNSLVTPKLDDAFKSFWDQVRRDRNRIMHSAAPRAFDPALVVRTLLTAVEALFGDVPWPRRLVDMEHEGKFAAFGFNDDVQNHVMSQVDDAIRHLQPSEARRFFGFDDDRRAYVCPHCYFQANRDWQNDWPHLAQLTTKQPSATSLRCVLCETVTEVERTRCESAACRGDVIAEGICLTCTSRQDECLDVDTGLLDPSLGRECKYEFVYSEGAAGRGGYSVAAQARLADDARAIEHARLTLLSEHLQKWDSVTVSQQRPRAMPDLTNVDRIVGHWRRTADGVAWHAGTSGDLFMLALNASPNASPAG